MNLRRKITENFGCFQIGKFHLLFWKIQAIFPMGMGSIFGPKNSLAKSLTEFVPQQSTVMVHGVFQALWYKSIMMWRHILRISTNIVKLNRIRESWVSYFKPRCWKPPGHYLCTPEPGRLGRVISIKKRCEQRCLPCRRDQSESG